MYKPFSPFCFNKQRPSLALHVEDTPFDVRQVGNSETKVMLETKRGGKMSAGNFEKAYVHRMDMKRTIYIYICKYVYVYM